MAEDNKSLLEAALANYKRGYEREQDNIEEAYCDQRFRMGEQWDPYDRQVREDEGRPCLTINQLPQFIRQVTGDMRQMRPSIKVFPVDSRGDPETADKLSGLIRYIENRSYARRIYTQAADMQVAAGIAHWEITTEFAGEDTFNQELRISPIDDGIAVIWDPDAILPTREDAKWCHVPYDITLDAFKERWPDKVPQDVDGKYRQEGWLTDDHVRLSKYWYLKPVKRTLALMPDGAIEEVDPREIEQIAFLQQLGARIEKRDGHAVYWCLMTCADLVEGPTKWAGPDIPVVPVIGEEVRVGRERYRHGLVRFARDPQRRYNAMVSAETETIALQPKAPFIATEDQVKNHIDVWQTANSKNHPVLLYTPDQKAPGIPQRVQPAVSSQGIAEAIERASGDIRRVTGIYDASLGARSNETSGRAILARQREGDVGTFVYIDNFALAIQRTGQILVRLIRHIYDTERTIRILGEDGKIDAIDINRAVLLNGAEQTINDVTVPAYDVTIDTGPSFSTRREEARDGMREFLQAFPAAAPVVGDLYARGQDWPNAEDFGERLEQLLPEPLKQKLAAKRQASGQGPPPEPSQPPNPQEEAAKALQLRKAAADVAMTEAEVEEKKSQVQLNQARAAAEMADIQQKQMASAPPAVGIGAEQVAHIVAGALAPVTQQVQMLAQMVAALADEHQAMISQPQAQDGQADEAPAFSYEGMPEDDGGPPPSEAGPFAEYAPAQ